MLICLVSGAAIGYRCALFRGHSHLKEILKSVHREVWSNPDVNAAMRAADELYTPERNMVMTRFMTTGTQTGDIPAIPEYQPLVPANGKFQQFPELAVHRIVNGKVTNNGIFLTCGVRTFKRVSSIRATGRRQRFADRVAKSSGLHLNS
jgi:hypothetical protein